MMLRKVLLMIYLNKNIQVKKVIIEMDINKIVF